MQTRTFRQKVLDAAKRDGSLSDLYWFVEFAPPSRAIPANVRPAPGTLTGPVTFAASAPGKWIPCVPVAPDPIISQQYAEVMLEVFKASNRGSLAEWALALTTKELLETYHWYEWGQPVPTVDHICPLCGVIINGPADKRPTTCMGKC